MNLNEYYLVKVFSKEKYMTDFNSGKNIYINSTNFFWKLENAFQQDEEGAIAHLPEGGYLIKTTPDVIHNSNSLDEILNCCNEKNKGQILAKASEFSLRLNGYICCFYLLPRKSVKFSKNTMSFRDARELKDFHLFLEKYIESSNNNDFYVSIYEPNTFCEIFFKIITIKKLRKSTSNHNSLIISVSKKSSHTHEILPSPSWSVSLCRPQTLIFTLH